MDKLRKEVFKCHTDKSYDEFKILKRALLLPAVEEINKKTDCTIEYEPIRRGRCVAAIKFTCRSKGGLLLDADNGTAQHAAATPSVNSDAEVETDPEQKYGSEQLAELAQALNCEFTREQMVEISGILERTVVEPDEITGSLYWGRVIYLGQKYEILNAVAQKRSISNRYAYFKAMLEKECGQ